MTPIVCVIWEDASNMTDGWETLDNLLQRLGHPIMCATVGFIIHETDDHIVLAQTMGREGLDVNGTLQIPRKMVRKTIKISDTDKIWKAKK